MKTTIGEWMVQQRDLDRLDCELLVATSLSMSRAQVIGQPEVTLEGNTLRQLNSWAARLRDSEPLAYLMGSKEFWGLSFNVNRDVLIPRPDTELLVELAIDLVLANQVDENLRILDLGTGSGIIAISIAHTLMQMTAKSKPAVEMYASERSQGALRVAELNAEQHGVAVHWLESDWFVDIPHSFDLIVSNPPYVAAEDPHLPALRHEPIEALCAGSDGLDALAAIVRDAPVHMFPGGWLLVEHGYDQAQAVQTLFEQQGYGQIRTERDLGDRPRVTLGKPGRTGSN